MLQGGHNADPYGTLDTVRHLPLRVMIWKQVCALLRFLKDLVIALRTEKGSTRAATCDCHRMRCQYTPNSSTAAPRGTHSSNTHIMRQSVSQ